MINFLFTFIGVFTGALVVTFLFGGSLNKLDFIFIVIIASFATIISYFKEVLAEIRGGALMARATSKRKEYELISFNNAIADEIMKIRLDLVAIKTKLNKKAGYWKNFPEDFVNIYLICLDYPYSAISAFYEAPNGKEGGIVILLDDIPLDRYGNFDASAYTDSFDAETLRKVKTFKTNKIKAGMNLFVHLYENDDNENFGKYNGKYNRDAKVITIEEAGSFDFDKVIVTLEIALISKSDCMGWCPNLDEKIEASKITRKIEMSRTYCHEFVIEEAKNLS